MEKRDKVIVTLIAIIGILAISYVLYNSATTFDTKKDILAYALTLDWDILDNYTLDFDIESSKDVRRAYLIDWRNGWYQVNMGLLHDECGWKDKTILMRFNINTGEHEGIIYD